MVAGEAVGHFSRRGVAVFHKQSDSQQAITFPAKILGVYPVCAMIAIVLFSSRATSIWTLPYVRL